LALPVAALAGAASALGAGGTSVGRRIAGAAAVATTLGVVHGLVNSVLGVIVWPRPGAPTDLAGIVWAFTVAVLWRVMLFGLTGALAAFAAEVAPARPRNDTTNYTN
jgi:hypothetical protein